MNVCELIFRLGITHSVGDARRAVQMHAVNINGVRIDNITEEIDTSKKMTIIVGCNVAEVTPERISMLKNINDSQIKQIEKIKEYKENTNLPTVDEGLVNKAGELLEDEEPTIKPISILRLFFYVMMLFNFSEMNETNLSTQKPLVSFCFFILLILGLFF